MAGALMKEKLKISRDRLLYLYSLLIDGKAVNKAEAAVDLNCSLRSVQRDIDNLRSFFYNQSEITGIRQDIVYDRKRNEYKLVPPTKELLKNEEVFAVLKILLESRALTKQELYPILDKLIDCCVPKENKRYVTELIGNEKFHYVEPQHKDIFLDKIWKLSSAVKERREINVRYKRLLNGEVIERKIQPVGIMFSEFYFYLVAFISPDENVKMEVDNDPFPTIYRIDRIKSYTITDNHFNMPYQNRFEEGEFRKRVQFMYGGKLQKIKFIYKGPSVEAVLDRLPTAQVLKQDENGYLINAEVFGKGIDMWLRSQGNMVEVVE